MGERVQALRARSYFVPTWQRGDLLANLSGRRSRDSGRRLREVDPALDRLGRPRPTRLGVQRTARKACQRGVRRKTLPIKTAAPLVATTRAMPATQSSSHGA